MEWKEEAWRLKRVSGYSWTMLFDTIREKYPETRNKSNQSIRSAVRRLDKKLGVGKGMPLPPPQDKKYTHLMEGRFKIGIVSDTHLNSNWQQLASLNKMYDIFKEENISHVYHAGDILAGEGMYPGQIYEIMNVGFDRQVQYVVDKYPCRQGIVTHFITGNHDLSYYKNKGADPGEVIALKRSDLDYLGKWSAWVSLGEHSLMYILHPDSGPAYAYSYKPQKIAEHGFEVGKEPDIMILGHWHQMEYFIADRNIHVIQAGCFEGQTTLLKRRGALPKIGGWIISGQIDDSGHITRLMQEAVIFPESTTSDF